MSPIGEQYHGTHISFSQKLLDEIIRVRDELLISIKNANQEYWNKMIHSALNYLIMDLHVAVHNFQQIEIKAKAATSSSADLKEGINTYNKIAYELQTELGKDSDIPKSFFETYIPQIINVAQKLVGNIKEDKLYEYEEEEIEMLNGILVALTQFAVTLEMENPEVIANAVQRKLDQFNQVLDDIDYKNPNILEILNRHANRANVQTPKLVHHLSKQSNNYEGKFKCEMLKTADLIHIAIAKLTIGLQESKDPKVVGALIKYIYNLGFSALIDFVKQLVAESKTVSVNDNLITLARYLGHEGIGLLTRDIQYFLSDTGASS